MHELGGELVAIGSGTPAQAKAFSQELAMTTPLVTDPTLEAYKRGGMKRGVLRTLSFKGVGFALRARRGGFKQTGTSGDPWQQGGVVVLAALDRGGAVTLQHAASAAGEPTDFGVMVEAMGRAAKG